MQVSAASWRTSLHLHRVSALLWGKVLEAKLDALDRAVKANFDPNQPRVPAGNPDGGQWTDAGGSGGDSGTSDVRIAQVRRGRRGGGSDAEATQAQLDESGRQGSTGARSHPARARNRSRHGSPSEPDQAELRRRRNSPSRRLIRNEAEARLRELAQQEPTSLMDAFRRQHGLDLLGDPVWSPEQNSVSTCQVDGVPYIGVNSQAFTYSDRDNATAGQLRDFLIQDDPSRHEHR